MYSYTTDENLIEHFLEETGEILLKLEKCQEVLSKNLDNPPMETLDEFLRLTHTIKGNASFLGLSHFSMLSHSLEEVIEGIQRKRVSLSKDLLDLIWIALDQVGNLVESKVTTGVIEINETVNEIYKFIDLQSSENKSSEETKEDPSAPKSEKEANTKTKRMGTFFQLDRSSVQKGPYVIYGVSLENIRNRNEARVSSVMNEILPKLKDFDQCQLCIEDVFALTMNHLPPEYAQEGSIVFRQKASMEQLKMAVETSAKQVMAKPNHLK